MDMSVIRTTFLATLLSTRQHAVTVIVKKVNFRRVISLSGLFVDKITRIFVKLLKVKGIGRKTNKVTPRAEERTIADPLLAVPV